jgi:hypothetical protein
VAVSRVPCPSLAVTSVSAAAELGICMGVLRFDITTVTVPVLEIPMLRVGTSTVSVSPVTELNRANLRIWCGYG